MERDRDGIMGGEVIKGSPWHARFLDAMMQCVVLEPGTGAGKELDGRRLAGWLMARPLQPREGEFTRGCSGRTQDCAPGGRRCAFGRCLGFGAPGGRPLQAVHGKTVKPRVSAELGGTGQER